MTEYGAASYGDGMADVYDDWYGTLDPTAAVERLATLAGAGTALELGVGTGRLAIPLAERGVPVVGIDASPAMLACLRAKPGGDRVEPVHADMGDLDGATPGGATPGGANRPGGPAPGPFSVVFVALNTFFSLTSEHAQRRCLAAVARRLAPAGAFVLEAFVPDARVEGGGTVEVRSVEADRVVLFVNRYEPDEQAAFGQFVDITAAGVRLRPSRIRYATPAQLDAMAAAEGLALERRWGGWDGAPFDATSTTHVSLYRHARDACPTP